MQRFTVMPGARLPIDGSAGTLVTNSGPGALFYADEEFAPATATIASGASATLVGTQYLFSAERCAVTVADAPILSVPEISSRLLSVETAGGAVTLAADQAVASLKTFTRGLKIADNYFEDDYAGTAAPLTGRVATTGQTWAVSGAGAATAVLDGAGRYVNDGNSYAHPSVPLSEVPLRIGGKFSFVAGGGADATAGMALIFAFQTGASMLLDHVHLTFDFDSCRLALWTSAATGNAVAADSDLVTGVGAPVNISTPLSLVSGTEYEVWMSIVDDQVHVEFLQADVSIGVIEASDPRVSTLVGAVPIWQISSPAGNAASLWRYRWESVYTVRRRPATLDVEIQAPGGITGPIGMRSMSAVYAKRLGVGTQAPAFPLDVLYDNTSALAAARIKAKGTTLTVLLETEGAGTGIEMRFQINGSTSTSAARIKSNGGANDLDFHVGSTAASRLALPSSTATGGIYLKGVPRWFTASLEQTTVGAAGAASAPPAAPTKWLKVMDSAGTSLVVPAYLA